ncbi:MAG: hypothetical protein Q8N26_06270 [Myxococcales bacterium]|nr:hypothetical protein [Myxococcales bacterium]
MRRFVLVVLLVGCSRPAVVTPESPGLRVSPGEVDFGRVWVGVEARRPLELQNPGRASEPVSVSVVGPFEVGGFPDRVQGGEVVTGWVSIVASAPGALEGTVDVGTSRATLRARAEAIPSCQSSGACRVSSFDLEAGACVERDAANDSTCTASFACFASATCQAGVCVGAATTCDDGNACTQDVCGENGCLHLEAALSCPVPSNPCQAPACDARTGCTSTEVVDGTPCGRRTCDTASVCIAGACVVRPAPQTQSCTDVVAGVPAGPGEVDGVGVEARFDRVNSMQYLPNGDLFVTDTNGSYGRIRRVSHDGTVRTMAGGGFGTQDGYGLAARFSRAPFILGLDPRGNLLVAEASDNGTDPGSLRRVSPTGIVTTACRACVGGYRVNTMLSRDATIISTTFGEQEPVQFALRFDDGRTRTLTATRLRASVSAFLSTEPLEVCALVNSQTRFVRFDPRADGGLDWVLGGPCPVPQAGQRYVPDGGIEQLLEDGPADDGPTSQVGVQSARNTFSLAFDGDGGFAAYDPLRFHIRRVERGFMRTLAGPVPRKGRVDGPVSLLASSPQGMAADPTGAVFTDADSLRRLDARGVTTLTPDAGSVGKDVAWLGSDVAWLGGQTRVETNGQTYFTSVDTLSRFSPVGQPLSQQVLARGDLTSIAVASDAGILLGMTSGPMAGDDGGFEPFYYSYRIRPGSGPFRAYTWATTVQGDLYAIGTSENWTAPLLRRDGGVPALTDFFEVSPGVVVGLFGREVIRVDLTTGTRVTIAQLSETPTSITAAPDGGAFLGVPNAILRLKFR